MREIHDLLFEKATEGMTAEEVLNYYRNLYHAEPQSTERGIVANALNDILPRMILPPCKVGDTVYYITGIHNTLVSGAKVTGIYYDNNDFVYYVCVGRLHFTLQQSETYFTREEAERALKGEQT